MECDGAVGGLGEVGWHLAGGYAGTGGGDAQAFALVRIENAGIFSDGFERGTAGGWTGN